ncbi:hypothetical protein BEN49_15510 [Hymenobacter coccineus]|uniref:Lipoprotein SmpA/OmlA domain-containing protein n=1 Tax=Hymenobacter coccineus TaxID=1908235 RepID=A0A1G1SRV2_9BACT|nr:hypothetical protein BEN49_15510 [Hymenobacter coccineus]
MGPLAAGLALAGCGHALPPLPGFAPATWRADTYGCQGRRLALLPNLLKAREKLYLTRADDINALLGQPDEEELREGTEKVYIYYLVPGPQCEPGHRRSAAPCLRLHFGPLGTVTEILVDPTAKMAQ